MLQKINSPVNSIKFQDAKLIYINQLCFYALTTN